MVDKEKMEENKLHYHMKGAGVSKRRSFWWSGGVDAPCGRDRVALRGLSVHGDGVFQGMAYYEARGRRSGFSLMEGSRAEAEAAEPMLTEKGKDFHRYEMFMAELNRSAGNLYEMV